MVETWKKTVQYEILDHGIENSSYFQGCGTVGTDWEEAATGCGDTQHEALADALENLAQGGWELTDELSAEVDKADDEYSASGSVRESFDMKYIVSFSGYAGVSWEKEFSDEGDARESVAKILKRNHKQGYPVSIQETGAEWCIEEREDGGMVPDNVGQLTLTSNEEELEETMENSETHYYVSVRVSSKDED